MKNVDGYLSYHVVEKTVYIISYGEDFDYLFFTLDCRNNMVKKPHILGYKQLIGTKIEYVNKLFS